MSRGSWLPGRTHSPPRRQGWRLVSGDRIEADSLVCLLFVVLSAGNRTQDLRQARPAPSEVEPSLGSLDFVGIVFGPI